jgi:hypothetical protein
VATVFWGNIPGYSLEEGGTWWRCRFRHCGFDSRSALVVDSASNRNECQCYLLRGKGGRCVELKTLPASCVECLQPQSSYVLSSGGRGYVVTQLVEALRVRFPKWPGGSTQPLTEMSASGIFCGVKAAGA